MQYITVAEAKDHLRVDFTDDDAYIASLIELVEELVKTEISGTYTGAGAVATAADTTLTGVSTNFTDFAVGDDIYVEGEGARTIATIIDDESLTVNPAFVNTADGLAWAVITGLPLTGGVIMPPGEGTVTTNTTTTLVGINSNFTEYAVGDHIYVSGETVRTILTITNNNLLTVSLAFTTGTAGHTFTVVSTQPVTLGSLPRGLKQAMLLMIGHFYMNREPAIIGVGINEIPYGFKYLVSAYKNWTVA
jgi:hypothetical protein